MGKGTVNFIGYWIKHMKEYTNITELIGFFKKRFTNLTKVMKKKLKSVLAREKGGEKRYLCQMPLYLRSFFGGGGNHKPQV
jgi:predicted AAA+ superfamily ATPase